MDNQTYLERRDSFIAAQLPFCTVTPQELISTGEHTYRVNGLELAVEPEVCRLLDSYLGLSKHQTKAVSETFGGSGIRDLRNYLALSNSIERAGKIALLANPDTRTVVGATPIKKEAIPVTSFFDFLEMFMNENDYAPEQFYTSEFGAGGVTVSLRPQHAIYDEFAPGDEFISNGVWFRWNLGEVEAENYYMRLICTNGQMARVNDKTARTNQLDASSMRNMLSLPQYDGFTKTNLEKVKNNALLAMQTDASVGEVQMANRLLKRYGVDESVADEIAPYHQLLTSYAAAGYHLEHFPLAMSHSDMRMWELFNRLTAYATHTTDWEADDNRRSGLMMESLRMLNRPRDIQRYVNIFH